MTRLKHLINAILITFTVAALLMVTLTAFTYLEGLCEKAFAYTSSDGRMKIAVIDTGIRDGLGKYICGKKDFTGYGIYDQDGHGTNVAGIIAARTDYTRECLLIVKWFNNQEGMGNKEQNEIFAINYAIDHGAKIINLSLSGQEPIPLEEKAIKRAIDRHIVVVVAAGNDGQNLSELCDYYPACYSFKSPYFRVIGSYGTSNSNYLGPVTDYANGTNVTAMGITMTGTSQAAAVYTSKLVNYYTMLTKQRKNQ